MKRTRGEEEEEEGTGGEKENNFAPKRSRSADPTAAKEDEARSNQVPALLGLEAVGDDVLLLIMDLCGPTDALRAFVLANHRLHALLRNHRALWRRAYTRLFNAKRRNKTDPAQLEAHLAGVADYFEAYTGVMRKWTGEFDFCENGVPLGESDGELTVKVGRDGRATWEGFGIGCGRAGEYTSLNCLKGKSYYHLPQCLWPTGADLGRWVGIHPGKGKLVLRFNKKGEIQPFAAGHEDSLKSKCDRTRKEDRYFYDDDEEDSGDDEDEKDQKEKEKESEEQKEKRAKEKKRAREEWRKKKAQQGDPASRWVEKSLSTLRERSFFFSSVDYQLHAKGRRKWCTGGGACSFWQDDMEW